MATTFSSFRAPIVSAAANPPNHSKRKSGSRTNNWWAPLFGWSSEPDYISIQSSSAKTEAGTEVLVLPEGESGRIRTDKSFFLGCFTEEKAKELRRKTIETSAFHDIMYHSAIASRLASDVSGRYNR